MHPRRNISALQRVVSDSRVRGDAENLLKEALKSPKITVTAEATTNRWNLMEPPEPGSHGTRIPSTDLSAVTQKDFYLRDPLS